MSPKQIAIAITAVIALIGGGFAAGRYAAPDKVTYKDREVLVYVDRAVTSVDTDKILNAIATMSQQKDVVKKKVTVKTPDGGTTITEETVDKTKTESKTEVQEKEKKVEVRVEERLVYKDRETIKTIERNRPQWSLALQPGFDLGSAIGGGARYNLLPSSVGVLKHAIVGMSIERQIVGPLKGGLWANSAGMVGVTVRWEF